jgi:murein DD-endopeptidase MepM/ murein hydrolase activator NlpD
MKELQKMKRSFFVAVVTITVLLSYTCISYAAKRAGTYWYIIDSDNGINGDYYSGYVVVDAIDARNSEWEGIGPYQGREPSFDSEDVELFEEGDSGGAEEDRAPGAAPPAPETSGDWKMITVASGETLSKISERHGISGENIMKANELTDPHRLREGQVLYIPNSPEAVDSTLAHVTQLKNEAVRKLKEASPLEMTDYVISNGDTLWSVANAFNLDVNSLFGCNKVSEGDILKVGSIVKIPNQDGIYVTVKKGQTVDKLAKEYGIYPEAIMSANRMADASSLKQDSRIFLPGAKVAAYVETNGSRRAVASGVKDQVTARRGFGWPVVGKISSSFGWRKDPIRGRRDFHTGLDIRAPRGRPIVASSAGRVVHSGWMGGYGRTIVISHPGNITTLYGHCSKLLANVGQTVKRGQRIALVGSTGRSTGNHVHFEVRSGGSPMNPIKLLR